MRVLVIGGGGREHAICAKLKESPLVTELLCAPGNAGIAQVARCFPAVKAIDINGMVALCREEAVDFVLVTPDDPLALGAVDRLREAGIEAFGPTAEAARLESSKAYAKRFMEKAGIPTAKWAAFDDMEAALSYLASQRAPIVVKADGLALGKGVVVAQTIEEARDAVRAMMQESRFGEAGRRVVIEECLMGQEATVLCFTDGKTLHAMPASQDHKRALDGDRGENTGGMGAFAPSPCYSSETAARVEAEILQPTLRTIQEEGLDFRGILYVGLMLTEEGPKVIEYNARFGDPETQVLMPLLETDLLEILLACARQRLAEVPITWRKQSAACVVLASGGYPGSYETGKPITGIPAAEADGASVFHAGTAMREGVPVTAGGRVLNVVAVADALPEALAAAYRAAGKISFEGMHLRTDIGGIFRDAAK